LNSIPEREDTQLIIVDDNSDPEIVDFLSFPGQNRKNVEIVFSKTGGGAGFARNLGLQIAKGKWILFSDADDFFDSCLSEVLEEFIDDPADIICFKNKSNHNTSRNKLNNGKWLNEFIDIYMNNPKKGEKLLRYLFVVAWTKLIKKNIIDDYSIKFDETGINEDITFSYLCGFYAHTIKADTRELYYWVYRENSLLRQNENNTIIFDKIYVYAKAILFYKKLRQGIRLRKMWLELFYNLSTFYINDKSYYIKAKKLLLNIGFYHIEVILGLIITLLVTRRKL
jgi:glycosyltransferase involved in cell wall biosynthesis